MQPIRPPFFYLFVLVSAFTLQALSAGAQRDTIPLNQNWQFVTDKTDAGRAAQWYTKTLPNAKTVNLPHTWNVERENEGHYGWGWYQKDHFIPADWKNKHLVLQFGAINHTAVIYVNGKKLAEHVGDGFNKFYVTLDGQVNYGRENRITLACNNDFGVNKVPFGSSFDWPNDGGLIRPVALIVSNKPSAAYLQALALLNGQDSSGNVNLKLGIEEKDLVNLRLSITVTEENQATKRMVYKAVQIPVWQNGAAVAELKLPKINPWHFDFPNLYRVEVTLLKGKTATDKIAATIGFRNIRFENGQTFLNGERIRLMGVEWTAGSNPDYGFAETEAEIIRHGRLMKDVNCIFSRVHFQQDDVFYDFCDRNGILIQEEIPLWGGETPSNDTIHQIALSQLRAMVRNHYNHPSIMTWGVGNELRGKDAAMKTMIEDLVRNAKALDPNRLVSYVSNTITSGFSNSSGFTPDAGSLGDYVMMNEYGGSWWDLPTAKIGLYMDSVHQSYPDKPFFISEFGLCEPNFKGGDQRRLEDLIYHMAVYESKPYVEGAIYFDLTDYRTHYPGTSDTTKYRRRIHGIYDMYGQPKPSMPVLRELSSPLEVQNVNHWKKGKMNILIFGSIGLPQHTTSGYTLYLSDKTDNYAGTKAYPIPALKPGEKLYLEVDDLYGGMGIVTVVRPTGYVATQKSFY